MQIRSRLKQTKHNMSHPPACGCRSVIMLQSQQTDPLQGHCLTTLKIKITRKIIGCRAAAPGKRCIAMWRQHGTSTLHARAGELCAMQRCVELQHCNTVCHRRKLAAADAMYMQLEVRRAAKGVGRARGWQHHSCDTTVLRRCDTTCHCFTVIMQRKEFTEYNTQNRFQYTTHPCRFKST